MKRKHLIACMKSAEAWAECSTATRLKVGAIAYKNGHTIAEGYNGLPSGMDGSCEDDEGNTRGEVTHAEDNLLRKLIRSTESSVGAVIFITHAPCKSCGIKIIDAGITRVYYLHDYRCSEGVDYLRNRGVGVVKLKYDD